jgi:hypothetical protein
MTTKAGKRAYYLLSPNTSQLDVLLAVPKQLKSGSLAKYFPKRYHSGCGTNLESRMNGRVAERLKALVLKTSNGKLFVGSNPTSSAMNPDIISGSK